VYLHQFTLDPTKRFALLLDRVYVTGNTASDPNPLTILGLEAEREYLLLHVLGTEGPNTDTYTWDSDYTAITGSGTTGHGIGPPTGDVHVRGGFRIASGLTSDTVDIASAIDRDNDQALVALTAIELDDDYAGFANTALIDDFNRANEDPLDGGIWEYPPTVHPQFGTKWLAVVSNQCAEGSGSDGGSQYVDETFLTEDNYGEFEVWLTLAVAHHAIAALATGNGNAATIGGTGLTYWDSGPRAFNGAVVPMGLIAFGDAGWSGNKAERSAAVWGHRANGTKIGYQ
jgi:hypothetical protein